MNLRWCVESSVFRPRSQAERPIWVVIMDSTRPSPNPTQKVSPWLSHKNKLMHWSCDDSSQAWMPRSLDAGKRPCLNKRRNSQLSLCWAANFRWCDLNKRLLLSLVWRPTHTVVFAASKCTRTFFGTTSKIAFMRITGKLSFVMSDPYWRKKLSETVFQIGDQICRNRESGSGAEVGVWGWMSCSLQGKIDSCWELQTSGMGECKSLVCKRKNSGESPRN